MTDTIELLEAIGSDASLRYAQSDELKGVLEQAQASAELTDAVTLGDGTPLRKGLKLNEATEVMHTHSPGHEDDDEDEDEDELPKSEHRQPDGSSGHSPTKKPH